MPGRGSAIGTERSLGLIADGIYGSATASKLRGSRPTESSAHGADTVPMELPVAVARNMSAPSACVSVVTGSALTGHSPGPDATGSHRRWSATGESRTLVRPLPQSCAAVEKAAPGDARSRFQSDYFWLVRRVSSCMMEPVTMTAPSMIG